ncbi:hypothetical protein BU24DRAFT_323026, partial [Aaosphaeria arxii CBS 175.79]
RSRRPKSSDPWAVRKKRPQQSSGPRPAPPTHHTCRICLETQPIDQYIQWITRSRLLRKPSPEVPAECMSHLAKNPRTKSDPVCKTCIGAAMSARLDMLGARTLSVGCLEKGCRATWSHDYIMKYLPSDVLDKYNVGLFEVWKHQAGLLTCINESCGASGLVEPGVTGYPQVLCHSCKFRMCAACEVPWHKGQTCLEYRLANLDEKMTNSEKTLVQKLMKKDCRRCTNCFMMVELLGGCDSVYCSGCKTYFNWSQAAPIVVGNKLVPPPV